MPLFSNQRLYSQKHIILKYLIFFLLFFYRVGQHPQDRKKKIIKEWQAGKPGTNGTSTSEVSAAAAAAAAARGFVDFPGYDPGNPIHYPYAYPDVNPLVNPWHHHHSLHGHHHPQHCESKNS